VRAPPAWPACPRPFRAAIVTALLAISAGAASAQKPAGAAPGGYADSLVFAASRYAQTLGEAPASVSVITREEILQHGYRTLGEVLGSARGIFTSYDRNYTYATVRGLSRPGDFNTRILLMVDGHRLNGALDDSGLLGTEGAVDLDAIERVEVIRGPGSSLYGTNAFYGVVNIVTRRAGSLAGYEGSAEAGTFGTYRGSLGFGQRLAAGVDVMASASILRAAGPDLYFPEFDAPATNGGRAIGLDGDRAEHVLGTVQAGDFRLGALYGSRRKALPTASFGTTFGDPRAFTRDSRTLLSLDYEHAFEDLSRVWTSLSYTAARYSGGYPYDSVLLRDYSRAETWTLEGQYLRFVGEHKVTVGGEARWNPTLEQGAYDVQPPFTYLADARSSSVWAAFVQGEFHLARRATLFAGVRHDQYSTFGGSTNPRAALVLQVAAGSTVRVVYGRAFRAPSAYELYYNDGGVTQKAASGLQPEGVQTLELAADHALGPQLRGTLSLYQIWVKDLVGLVTDPADSLLVYRNLSRARSTGVEVEVGGRVGPISGRVSYAYQHAWDSEQGGTPLNSPQHVAKLGLSAPLDALRATVSLDIRYLGARPSRTGVAGSYTLANLTLLVRPFAWKGLEISGSVYNLWDTRYGDVGGEELVQEIIPQDGRTFRVGARVRL